MGGWRGCGVLRVSGKQENCVLAYALSLKRVSDL